jgi:hypothetical protein
MMIILNTSHYETGWCAQSAESPRNGRGRQSTDFHCHSGCDARGTYVTYGPFCSYCVVVVCPIVALLVLFILHLTGTCECECVCAFVCFSLNRLRTYVFTDEVYTICVLTVDVSRNSIRADNCS